MKKSFYSLVFILLSACGGDFEEFIETDANENIITKGQLKDGIRTGKWIFFHTNGNKKHQTNYIQGLEHGSFKFWDEQGRLLMQGEQDSGKFVWVEEFYPNGNYSSALSYQPPGIKNDTLKTWFENGQIQTIGKYKEDQKTGVWKSYLENGRLYLMQHYFQDTLLKKEQNFDANFIHFKSDKVKFYTTRTAMTYFSDTLVDLSLSILDHNGNSIQDQWIQFQSKASDNFLGQLNYNGIKSQLSYQDDFLIKGPEKAYKILKFSNLDYTLFFNEYYGIISIVDRRKEEIIQLKDVGPGMIFCYQEPISVFFESEFYTK